MSLYKRHLDLIEAAAAVARTGKQKRWKKYERGMNM